MFANGHLYYLVGVISNWQFETTAQPVDQTVIVDAERRIIVAQFDHADPDADANIRTFFNQRP